MSMDYLVIVEQGDDGFGAYLPDLPGCVASAGTREEVIALIREAIPDHIELMREGGEQIPEPTCTAEYVSVPELTRV